MTMHFQTIIIDGMSYLIPITEGSEKPMKKKQHRLEIVNVKEEPTVIDQKGGFPLSIRELKRLLKKWIGSK